MPKEPKTKELKTKEPKEAATKKPRTKKDKEAPKNPLSAYMFFVKENRARLKIENPEASFGELGKIVGEKWKELDDDEKTPYADSAAEDKKRFETESAAYKAKKAGDDE